VDADRHLSLLDLGDIALTRADQLSELRLRQPFAGARLNQVETGGIFLHAPSMGYENYCCQGYVSGAVAPTGARANNGSMEWNEAVGSAIRHFRKMAKLKQAEFAAEVEVSQGDLSKVETGGRGLSFDSLERFARALKMRPSEVLEFAEGLKGVGASLPASERADRPADIPLLINRLEGDIDQLRTLIVHGMRAVTSRLPGAAAEIEQALLAETDGYYSERGAQPVFLDVLREVREAEEAAQPSARPPAKRGKSR
jgi:transcriptional regulator with XRE-family HTH domain